VSGLYLEDYTVGRVFETEPVTLDVDEIIWFAEQYDPQVFHTDPEGAKNSAFGEHIASGFQTVAIATGQFIRTGAVDGTGMGGPGLDEIRWTAPVRPGDTLLTTVEVTEARATRSNPLVLRRDPRRHGDPDRLQHEPARVRHADRVGQ
jgi:acyl dehydratase